MTYSSGNIIIALQEVLARNLQFHNDTYSELPASIKIILDNLQSAFIENHRNVFQQTLRALEIHPANLATQTEIYTSHYANFVSESGNLASDNEAFESHLVQPNTTDEPYGPYTSQHSFKEMSRQR